MRLYGSPICELLETCTTDGNQQGVYSGVEASGNGNSEAGNLDATFLRGIQKSDEDGVVYFQSVFPGHYTGRATHIHGMYRWTLDNGHTGWNE
jgi:hypothetical protein